ncbi:MAG TPA: hypothetical protein ENK57_12205 [Polyangiaceae bacterium]|nr:hypothetical protein [Polyangiaceae bacterium]
MTFYWVEFTDRGPGTIETEVKHYPEKALATPEAREAFRKKRDADVEAEILKRGAEFGTVKSFEILPYPADPRLDVRHKCPSFCWTPNHCKGSGSCPRSRSCTS